MKRIVLLKYLKNVARYRK